MYMSMHVFVESTGLAYTHYIEHHQDNQLYYRTRSASMGLMTNMVIEVSTSLMSLKLHYKMSFIAYRRFSFS